MVVFTRFLGCCVAGLAATNQFSLIYVFIGFLFIFTISVNLIILTILIIIIVVVFIFPPSFLFSSSSSFSCYPPSTYLSHLTLPILLFQFSFVCIGHTLGISFFGGIDLITPFRFSIFPSHS